MAWEGSERRQELPPNWAALREACARAARWRCEWRLTSGARCPRRGTDADHYGAKDDHTKLRWLCRFHHDKHTAMQARMAKKADRARRYRPPEQHPGSLS